MSTWTGIIMTEYLPDGDVVCLTNTMQTIFRLGENSRIPVEFGKHNHWKIGTKNIISEWQQHLQQLRRYSTPGSIPEAAVSVMPDEQAVMERQAKRQFSSVWNLSQSSFRVSGSVCPSMRIPFFGPPSSLKISLRTWAWCAKTTYFTFPSSSKDSCEIKKKKGIKIDQKRQKISQHTNQSSNQSIIRQQW